MKNRFKVDFISVGPQKTCTTWLYENLKEHPALCFPRNVKETRFFDIHYEQGLHRYASYFQHQQRSQLAGEIAPSYFDVTQAPERILSLNPDCKILISLRSPVDRAFSLYCHHLRKGRVPRGFDKAINKMPRILSSGLYARHIPCWINAFGKDQIFFLLMDDIKQQPEIVLSSVYDFLNIETPEIHSYLTQKVNEASMPRISILAKLMAQTASYLRAQQFDGVVELAKKIRLNKIYEGGNQKMPKITHEESLYLAEYYRDDIEYVETLLGRTLPQWKFA